MSLQDKVIIVTGAANGIGLALVNHLLENGAKVFGVDIKALPKDGILSENDKFSFHQCDLTVGGSAEETVKAAQAKFGPQLHGLANVAGIMDKGASVDTLIDSDWDRVLAINLTAPVRLMSAFVKALQEQKTGGAIVNVSSKAGTSGACAGCAYTASKHGLIGATKNVAWRFAEEGIRCNAIAPGGVTTNIFGNSVEGGFQAVDQLGWGRSAGVITLHSGADYSKNMSPQDIVPSLAFLLSDGSRMISGAVLPIDRATWRPPIPNPPFRHLADSIDNAVEYNIASKAWSGTSTVPKHGN